MRAEADAGRLAPWLAVRFGTGILLFFAAPAEPSLYAPAIPFVLFAALTWASRERPFAFALAMALTDFAAGFGAGCVRGAMVAHPVAHAGDRHGDAHGLRRSTRRYRTI